jgi:LmbE family N-acetylglucosaminyl deacetylase
MQDTTDPDSRSFERILIVGAHPDDAEFHAGGLMISQAARGSLIRILALTDGSAGHHVLGRAELAERRRGEAERAAARIPAEVEIWDEPDGELMPDLPRRQRLIKAIRSFAPDLVVTHRPNDYHPDHRATALLVQDACYLLRVPAVVPEVPPLAREPVVLACADFFSRPNAFTPDVVLPMDEAFEAVVDLLACHESQVFEWLPHMDGTVIEGDRRAWLSRYYGRRPAAIARRYEAGCQYAEAFELSEYGRRMPLTTLRTRLGRSELA